MTEKRYQVFVSSTSKDLEPERRLVIDALLESSYIPVGMELFSAATESAWPVIERLIDNCDYYIVIVAGRYGTEREGTGKSFTQAEYEYAQANRKAEACVFVPRSRKCSHKIRRTYRSRDEENKAIP